MSSHHRLPSGGHQLAGRERGSGIRSHLGSKLAAVVSCGLVVGSFVTGASAAAEPGSRSAATTHSAPVARISIVGGGSAAIARFPFQVALYDPRAGSVAGGFFC